MKAIAKYTRIEDPEMLQETLAQYRAVALRALYPTPAGLQTLLDLQAESDPRARSMRPQDVVDSTALEQLEREGYLRQLYGE